MIVLFCVLISILLCVPIISALCHESNDNSADIKNKRPERAKFIKTCLERYLPSEGGWTIRVEQIRHNTTETRTRSESVYETDYVSGWVNGHYSYGWVSRPKTVQRQYKKPIIEFLDIWHVEIWQGLTKKFERDYHDSIVISRGQEDIVTLIKKQA